MAGFTLTLVLRRQTQEEYQLKARLSDTGRTCLKNKRAKMGWMGDSNVLTAQA